MKLQEIYDGWKNAIIPEDRLKPHIARVAASRMNICNTCEYDSNKHTTFRPDRHCIYCGCTLRAKTRSLTTECPIGKWVAAVKDKENGEAQKNDPEKDSII